ncbi:MAG: hypothetical protein HUU01_22020, partial [Saprospiraceae bacterium]|nr:hypothetical protein [Saprospiraceae bacterium]
MKRNKEFDRSIREKLENLAPGFNAGSWDKLENRLDSEDAQSEWDAQLSQRLRQIERPYNRASWQALAERLDLEEKRLNGIYSAKAKELLFMALLLWSVTRFLTFPPMPQEQAYKQTPGAPLPAAPYHTNTGQPACSTTPSDLQAALFADNAATKAWSNPSAQEQFSPKATGSASGLSLLSTFATTPLLNGSQGIADGRSTAFLPAPGLPQVVSPLVDAPEVSGALHHFFDAGSVLPPNALLAEASPIATSGMPGLLPER